MRFPNFWKRLKGQSKAAPCRRDTRLSRRKLGTSLSLEWLEDRRLLTVITPASFFDTNASFTPFTPTSANISVPTLRDAVIEANYITGANTIKLNPGIYTLSLYNTSDGTSSGTPTGHETASTRGDLNITSNLTIQGVGVGPLPLTIIKQTVLDRVFEINAPATGSPPTAVTFQNVNIQGGQAIDSGLNVALPHSAAAEGGGILDAVSGLSLTLSGVVLQSNKAEGLNGGTTSNIGPGTEAALGGGLYVSGATVSLTNVTFLGNQALAGSATAGTGGSGGDAEGGGLYADDSTIIFGNSSKVLSLVAFASNQAIGGAGGTGGSETVPGPINSGLKLNIESIGGSGGSAGSAEGGGMAAVFGTTVGDTTSITRSNFSLDLATFLGNTAKGGIGGNGGSDAGGLGGSGGSGGWGYGGGLYAYGATVTLTGSAFTLNQAVGSAGGLGGAGTTGGSGGGGGDGLGGGIYDEAESKEMLAPKTTVVHQSLATPLALYAVAFGGNLALGGNGGNGGTGTTTGGSGASAEWYQGYAYGGALYVDDITASITLGAMLSNTAQGGIGGNGGTGSTLGYVGAGGWGLGGGLYDFDSTVVINGALITLNFAKGAKAGSTGLTNSSTVGGDGLGAGAFVDYDASLTLQNTLVTLNVASAAPGGTAAGGGVYYFVNGTDNATLTTSGLTFIILNLPNNVASGTLSPDY
jgi:hypothetical protein